MVKDSVDRRRSGRARLRRRGALPLRVIVGDHDAATVGQYVAPTCLPDRLGAQPAPGASYGREYYYGYPATSPLVRLIMTAPGVGLSYAPGSPHRQWLIDAIDSARNAGTKSIVVGNHSNYISMGQKTNEIGADYFDLLVDKRVDLIVQSHDHTYREASSWRWDRLLDDCDGNCRPRLRGRRRSRRHRGARARLRPPRQRHRRRGALRDRPR